MNISKAHVTNRAIDIINSCTKPSQVIMAQSYLYLLIKKIECSITEIDLIYKVRDMIEIKIQQLVRETALSH